MVSIAPDALKALTDAEKARKGVDAESGEGDEKKADELDNLLQVWMRNRLLSLVDTI